MGTAGSLWKMAAATSSQQGVLMSAFGGFPPETIRFLRQLRANNRKDWFDAQRTDYEAFWVAPAEAFVVAAGQLLAELAPGIWAEPRVLGSIFRINRDTRFAHDASPYKDHLDFWFWEGERRRAVSGFFARLTPEFLGVGAGCHGLDPEGLTRFRQAVTRPFQRRGAGWYRPAPGGGRLPAGWRRAQAARRRASTAVAPPGASCSTRPCSSTTTNRSTSGSNRRDPGHLHAALECHGAAAPMAHRQRPGRLNALARTATAGS
jgi:hypothetical protein